MSILAPRAAAGIDLVGKTLDVMGGLYLAYDVFRRHAGPLGILTRAATYSVVLAVLFAVPLGASFGAIAGAGIGSLLALEYWLLARHQRLQRSSPLVQSWWSGAARGMVLGCAAVPRFGMRFGATLLVSESCTLGVIYGLGLVPTSRFSPRRLTFSRTALRGALLRALAMGAAAAAAAGLVWGEVPAERFGLLIAGLTTLAGFLLTVSVPYLEYWVENAPESFFIAAGLALLFCGLVCDSIPSVLVLLGG